MTKKPAPKPTKQSPSKSSLTLPKTPVNWPAVQKAHPEANFLQSPAWAITNQKIGHTVLECDFGDGDAALMIIKDAKRGRYLEIPGGPLLNWQDTTKVLAAFTEIKKLAKAQNCVFIRFRPQLKNTPENLKILSSFGATPAPMHLAAEHTVILDLEKSEDELLSDLRRQTRYEVRRSAKLGITVEHSNSETLFKEFHQAQAETAARQHFVPPDLKTLLAERDGFKDDAEIYVAYTSPDDDPEADAETPGKQPIAYGLIFTTKPEAAYYEAASTDLNRKLPGAYALQWQVIKDLKKQGAKRYNLWGIAPPNQPDHRYAGVTTFKTGFGGEVVEFVPAHDIIIDPLKYSLDLIVEKARKKWRHL